MGAAIRSAAVMARAASASEIAGLIGSRVGRHAHDRRRRWVDQRLVDQRGDPGGVDRDTLGRGHRHECRALECDARVDRRPPAQLPELGKPGCESIAVVVDDDRQRDWLEQTADPGDGLFELRAVPAVPKGAGEHPLVVDHAADIGVRDHGGRPARDELDLALLEPAERGIERLSGLGLGHATDVDATEHDPGQDPARVRLTERGQRAEHHEDAEQRADHEPACHPTRSPEVEDAAFRRDGLCGGHRDHPEWTRGRSRRRGGSLRHARRGGKGVVGPKDCGRPYCANVSQSSGLPLR